MAQSMSKTETERAEEPKFSSRLEGGGLGAVFTQRNNRVREEVPFRTERVSLHALNSCCCTFLIFLKQKTLEVAQRREIITGYGGGEGTV